MAQTSTMGGSLTVIPKGKMLRDLREKMGLKQREVEAASGIPPGRLSQYEASKPIPLDYLEMLSSFYKVSARDLTNSESMQVTLGLAARIAQLYDGELKFRGAENG